MTTPRKRMRGLISSFNRRRTLLIGCLAACTATCSHRSDITWLQPKQDEDRPKIPYLTFMGSNIVGFTDADGRSCRPFAGHQAARGMLGWKSDGGDAACSHDTQYEGVGTATLELRWNGRIPSDGAYELNTFGYTVMTRGEVVCRGGWTLEAMAVANLVVEASSPHCSLFWSTPLATAMSFGPETRATPFTGYKEIPPLQLGNCKAGEVLDVRTRLIADANRGRIDVDSFGFQLMSDLDARQLFGLVLKDEVAQAKPGPMGH
jgi:hypothetical protein